MLATGSKMPDSLPDGIILRLFPRKSGPTGSKMPDSLPDGIGWCIADKHKKVEQALGRSLRSLFEQLARGIRQLRCLFRITLSKLAKMEFYIFDLQVFIYKISRRLQDIEAPALAYTHASASKQAAQAKPKGLLRLLCASNGQITGSIYGRVPYFRMPRPVFNTINLFRKYSLADVMDDIFTHMDEKGITLSPLFVDYP